MGRPRYDTGRLPAGVWFVRSFRGRGLTPVTSEGNRVAWRFVAGMVVSALVGGGLAAATGALWWLGVMVLGMIASGTYFIVTARRHGNPSINAMDLMTGSEP